MTFGDLFQRNMCETANQQSISSHMVVYMACKMRCRWLTFRRCFVNRALSRNRSLRDAKLARHLFVWFAKDCLAEHCLSFRGDADECEKQFCFVFRICLVFFDSRLWRPYLWLVWTKSKQLGLHPFVDKRTSSWLISKSYFSFLKHYFIFF